MNLLHIVLSGFHSGRLLTEFSGSFGLRADKVFTVLQAGTLLESHSRFLKMCSVIFDTTQDGNDYETK